MSQFTIFFRSLEHVIDADKGSLDHVLRTLVHYSCLSLGVAELAQIGLGLLR